MNKKIFHYNTLNAFNSYLFNTLLHEHHVISDSLKEIETQRGLEQGYFLKKDRLMYFIDRKTLEALPIRVKEQEESVEGKNVYYKVTKASTFRLKGNKTMSLKQLVKTIAPFNHTNPKDWELYKILCIAAYCSRTFVRISTNPGFGKDSMKGIMNSLTDKVRIIKPRSIAGVMKELTEDGEIVMNEVSGIKKEIRDLIQDIILHLGDGSVVYTNGALKSAAHHTKDRYKVGMLSITAMYNRLQDYKSKDEFFDYQFSNNSAIRDRLLPFLFNGAICEDFQLNFDFEKEMMENLQTISEIVNNIAYWKEHYREELKPYSPVNHNYQGRHKQTIEVIFDFINCYAESEEEYRELCEYLLKKNKDYYAMINMEDLNTTETTNTDKVEIIDLSKEKETEKQVKLKLDMPKLADLKQGQKYYLDELKEMGFSEYAINKALEEGDIFEVSPTVIMRLQ